jgi:hypothetical protein
MSGNFKVDINLNTIILLIMGGIGLWLLFKKDSPVSQQPVIVNVIDSSSHSYSFSNRPPDVSVTMPVPQVIDTGKIIREYYTNHFYADTLRDSSVEIVSLMNVNRNNRQDFVMNYKILRPMQQIIHPAPDPARRVSVGLMGGWDGAKPIIAPLVSYANKKDDVIGVWYNGKGGGVYASKVIRIKRR